MTIDHLEYVVLGVPLIAVVGSLLSMSDPAERHHLHHDTYSISKVVSRTLVLVMIFIGVLGGLTGWLCHLDVFSADPVVPLGFFVAFQLTLLFTTTAISRCQVTAYADRMFVRPWVGRSHEVPYARITWMGYTKSLINPGFHDLRVRLDDNTSVRVSGLLDVEQILMRIDRYDVLEG